MAKAGRRLISNKDQWQKILAKIAPLTESGIKECLENIDIFFNTVEKLYSYKEALTKLLEKYPCPEWCSLYDNDVSQALVKYTAPLFDDPLLLETITNNPKELSTFYSKPPLSNKAAETFFSNEENIPPFIAIRRAQLIDTASLFIHQKRIASLIHEAKSGQDEALFKIITLDKALITSEWIIERIRKETLKGNAKFLKQVGLALTRNIDFKKQKITLKLQFFLMQLWSMGFSHLTDTETCFILDKFDVYATTPDTLRVIRQRMGLTRSKLQPTDLGTPLQQK